MRSRTGCLTCRQRKVKCDEIKPVCGNCIKSSRECIESPGLVFRHQQNASIVGDGSSEGTMLKGFYAYRDRFEHDAIWLHIPKLVTFINTSNPYVDPPSPELKTVSATSIDLSAACEPHSGTPWLISASTHSTNSSPSNMSPDPTSTNPATLFVPRAEALLSSIQPSSTFAAATPCSAPALLCSHFTHSNMDRPTFVPLLPIDAGFTSLDAYSEKKVLNTSSTPSSQGKSTFLDQNSFPVSDRDTAFLLRRFSEGPGCWMDVFDTGAYFSAYVPVKACASALIKHAVVACAAKATARVQACELVTGGNVMRHSRSKLCHDTQSVDWQRRAGEHYNAAVSLLLQALKNDAATSMQESDDIFRTHSEDVGSASDNQAFKWRSTVSNCVIGSGIEDILTASAILCMYEFLGTSVLEGIKHLDGAKSLFSLVHERTKSLQLPSPGPCISSTSLSLASKARRATFWNIVRQDMLAAFINKTKTRIDVENLSMWREAGLLVDSQGFIVQSRAAMSGSSDYEGLVEEALISNTLVWLTARLINFLAPVNDCPEGTELTWTGAPKKDRPEYWSLLQQQFQAWHDGLPATFRASARVDLLHSSSTLFQDKNRSVFPEVWYSTAMCASAKQNYHMSQILLHRSEVYDPNREECAVNARLSSYQHVSSLCQMHGREIVGISLAHTDEATRVNSVQPLFVAGQCFVDPRERHVVITLLREIESDIGWSTDYRVRQLVEQWKWKHP